MTHRIVGSEAFDRPAHVLILNVRDRRRWRRELAGLWSDLCALMEAIGQRFVFGRPVEWR